MLRQALLVVAVPSSTVSSLRSPYASDPASAPCLQKGARCGRTGWSPSRWRAWTWDTAWYHAASLTMWAMGCPTLSLDPWVSRLAADQLYCVGWGWGWGWGLGGWRRGAGCARAARVWAAQWHAQPPMVLCLHTPSTFLAPCHSTMRRPAPPCLPGYFSAPAEVTEEGMIVHPLAREPAHYGSVCSLAAGAGRVFTCGGSSAFATFKEWRQDGLLLNSSSMRDMGAWMSGSQRLGVAGRRGEARGEEEGLRPAASRPPCVAPCDAPANCCVGLAAVRSVHPQHAAVLICWSVFTSLCLAS